MKKPLKADGEQEGGGAVLTSLCGLSVVWIGLRPGKAAH